MAAPPAAAPVAAAPDAAAPAAAAPARRAARADEEGARVDAGVALDVADLREEGGSSSTPMVMVVLELLRTRTHLAVPLAAVQTHDGSQLGTGPPDLVALALAGRADAESRRGGDDERPAPDGESERRRDGDDFLEELKQRQAVRDFAVGDARAAVAELDAPPPDGAPAAAADAAGAPPRARENERGATRVRWLRRGALTTVRRGDSIPDHARPCAGGLRRAPTRSCGPRPNNGAAARAPGSQLRCAFRRPTT